MNCDQVRELLEAYVLEALDADEQAGVELHLQQCPDCQRTAREYADVVNRLPEALAAVSPLRPPAAMKARLLRSLEAASAQAPRAGQSQLRDTRDAEGSPLAYPLPGDEKAARAPRRPALWQWSSWRRIRMFAAVAAVILLALSLLWGVRLSEALARERALRAEFADLVGQQELVLEVVDSDKTVRHILRSPDSTSRAYGKLYTRSDMPHVVVMAARLPPPPSGQAYHLWLTSGRRTQLAGTLAVNSQGFGLLIFKADRNGPSYESAEITLQPMGSSTPSAPPVLLWEAGAEQ